MAIILENIKNRNNVYNKTQYRYMDYNDLAIGQIGLLLKDFLDEKTNNNEMTINEKNIILKNLNINKNYDVIEDLALLKECLVSIEFDSIQYNNQTEYPKENLKYLYEIAKELKIFYAKKDNKHIYPNLMVDEIFAINEINNKSIEDFLNYDTFINDDNNVVKLKEEFLSKLENELFFTTINQNSPRYDINSISLDKNEYYLNLGEIKQLAPILINGNSLIWKKFANSSMTTSNFDFKNIDIDESIKMLNDINYQNVDKSEYSKYTYQYLNDKLQIDKEISKINTTLESKDIDKNTISIKLFLLKNILEIDSLGSYLLNNNVLKTYKTNLISELNKINRIKENNNEDFIIDNYKKIYNNINTVMSSFRNENSSINIVINDNNINKVFSFDSNYYQIKTLFDAYAKKNGLSLLLPGPPDFGKSHSTNELVELFGGIVIKQEHIMSLSALSATFEKKPANFDPTKRTHPLTELKTSILNGEYGNGIIHMEEGARTFMELLNNKVNSPDESALLSILEPMSRSNTYWKIEAYGQNIKLFPSEHVKFIWSTNFIPKNISNEIQVRFTSIPMDFSTISNNNSLKTIINNMLYKMNLEREVENFSNTNNSIKYINMLHKIYSSIKETINSFDLNGVLQNFKDSNSFEDYKLSLTKTDMVLINKFMLENRINPYILFKAKENIENLFNEIKDYSSKLDKNLDVKENLNEALKFSRINRAINDLNEEFNLNININESIEKYGLSIDTIIKSLEEKGIVVDDILQRYHTLDFYYMTIISQFKILDSLKIDLKESKSIINNDVELLSTIGKYIVKDIDLDFISNNKESSEIILYDRIKDDYLNFVSKYNFSVQKDYKDLVKSYNNQYSITPFKSTDAPIIGFEKILKSINGLCKNKGFIDAELEKIMTSGTNLNKITSMMKDFETFVKIEIDDISLGG